MALSCLSEKHLRSSLRRHAVMWGFSLVTCNIQSTNSESVISTQITDHVCFHIFGHLLTLQGWVGWFFDRFWKLPESLIKAGIFAERKFHFHSLCVLSVGEYLLSLINTKYLCLPVSECWVLFNCCILLYCWFKIELSPDTVNRLIISWIILPPCLIWLHILDRF